MFLVSEVFLFFVKFKNLFAETAEATVQVETYGAARTTNDGLRWKQQQSKHTGRLETLERMSTWLILRFYANLGHLLGHLLSSIRVIRLTVLSAVSLPRFVSQRKLLKLLSKTIQCNESVINHSSSNRAFRE